MRERGGGFDKWFIGKGKFVNGLELRYKMFGVFFFVYG